MGATLDAKGLKCPLPVLRARKVIRGLAVGEVLEVFATDPSATRDFRAFCAETGHDFIAESEADGVYSITVRKKA